MMIEFKITTSVINDDGQDLFEARVAEFPHLIDYHEDEQEAIALLTESIECVRQDCAERNNPFPIPIGN